MTSPRIPLTLAVAACFPLAPPAFAQPIGASDAGRVTLAAETEARWITFDLTPGNQIRFTATIDGRPVTAILDTGVSYSVLAGRYARENGMTVAQGGEATAVGGVVKIGLVATRSVAFGGLTRAGGNLTVAELPAIATGSATPVDLLVGRDLTAAHALDIDYAQRRFRLMPSGRLPFVGSTAPLTIARDQHVYVSGITLGGAQLKPMIVDTGDGSSVTVTNRGWQASGLTGVRTTTAISYGLAGPVTSTIGIVPRLAVGALNAQNVEIRIEPEGGFSERVGAAGRIGSGFLQHYRVLLDPAAGRMVLAPEAGADAVPLRSTSGLLLGVERDKLRVLHVMRGGPAAIGGWRAGDLICSVDAQPITTNYAASAQARWTAGAPGTTVALGMCDGTARQLTLAAFY